MTNQATPRRSLHIATPMVAVCLFVSCGSISTETTNRSGVGKNKGVLDASGSASDPSGIPTQIPAPVPVRTLSPVPSPTPGATITPSPTPTPTPDPVVTPSPSLIPADHLNIKNFGAKGDGVTNDQAAIATAFSEAKRLGKVLYVPEGRYLHNAQLAMDSITVIGDGDKSVFHATDHMKSSIKLTGNWPTIRNLKVTVDISTAVRQSTGEQNALTPWNAQGFIIDNVTVDGAASICILNYGGKGESGAKPAKITNSRVSNCLADGIHNTKGAQYVLVEGNEVSGNEDDCFAVVSYKGDGVLSSDIVIRKNKGSPRRWGRGATVVGGTNVIIEDNEIGKTEHAGIYIASENSWNTFDSSNVTVRRNKVANSCYDSLGACPTWHSAIFIFSETSLHKVFNVRIHDNFISNPNAHAFRAIGAVDDVVFMNNDVTGLKAGRQILSVENGATNVTETGTVVH